MKAGKAILDRAQYLDQRSDKWEEGRALLRVILSVTDRPLKRSTVCDIFGCSDNTLTSTILLPMLDIWEDTVNGQVMIGLDEWKKQEYQERIEANTNYLGGVR